MNSYCMYSISLTYRSLTYISVRNLIESTMPFPWRGMTDNAVHRLFKSPREHLIFNNICVIFVVSRPVRRKNSNDTIVSIGSSVRLLLLLLIMIHHDCMCHPWYKDSWSQHGAHLGPTGPRWATCWPHELCYRGQYKSTLIYVRDLTSVLANI